MLNNRKDVGVALVLVAAIVFAGYHIGNMQKIGKAYDRSVQVKGLAEREVNADLAVWPMNIRLTGNDLSDLKERTEKQNQTVYTFFINQGFSDQELSKGLVEIRDFDVDNYYSRTKTQYRYTATSNFTVRTRDIQKLQKAFVASLDLMNKDIVVGSKDTWRPVQYFFTALNELKPQMIEEATKNAREVAGKFASGSASEVGKIIRARQGLFTITNRDENTPEIKKVRVVSTIDFQLKD